MQYLPSSRSYGLGILISNPTQQPGVLINLLWKIFANCWWCFMKPKSSVGLGHIESTLTEWVRDFLIKILQFFTSIRTIFGWSSSRWSLHSWRRLAMSRGVFPTLGISLSATYWQFLFRNGAPKFHWLFQFATNFSPLRQPFLVADWKCDWCQFHWLRGYLDLVMAVNLLLT